MEQDIYKRKSGGTDIINPRRAWEKLLLAARAIFTTQTTADDSVVTSRNTGQGSVLWFAAAATGATPIVGHMTPGIFMKQIQGACQECCLLLVIDPKADDQPPMSLWVTQTLLCTVWTLPPVQQLGSSLNGHQPCGGGWPGTLCSCVGSSPVNTRARSYLVSNSTEILKGWKTNSRLLLKRLRPSRNFTDKGLLQIPSLLPRNPR